MSSENYLKEEMVSLTFSWHCHIRLLHCKNIILTTKPDQWHRQYGCKKEIEAAAINKSNNSKPCHSPQASMWWNSPLAFGQTPDRFKHFKRFNSESRTLTPPLISPESKEKAGAYYCGQLPMAYPHHPESNKTFLTCDQFNYSESRRYSARKTNEEI